MTKALETGFSEYMKETNQLNMLTHVFYLAKIQKDFENNQGNNDKIFLSYQNGLF
jgi:hypothetical protein